MVEAVLESLEEKKPLVVEAGTGVGKTLAYLVPLIAKALSRQKRVLVSTYTISLQDQILKRDVPLLNEIFKKEIGRDLKAVVLKGRSRYLCLNAWNRLLKKEFFTDEEIRVVLKVFLWLETTVTGELSELQFSWEERKISRRLSSNGESCLGAKCFQKKNCFVNLAREKAKKADLVITNQALLLSDTRGEKGILPEYDYLVIDEAQHLEEVATDRYTRVFAVEELRTHTKELNDILLSYLKGNKENLFSNPVLRGKTSDLEKEVSNFSASLDILEGLLGMLSRFLQSKHQSIPVKKFRITSELDNYLEWQKVLDSLKRLQHNLDLLGDKVMEVSGQAFLEKDTDPESFALALDLQSWNEVNDRLQSMITKIFFTSFENKVMWLRENKKEQVFVQAAPLQVAEMLSKELFTPDAYYLLTSATLAAAGDFTYFKESLGLIDELHEEIIPSGYNYSEQAKLFIPIDFPAPDAKNFMKESVKLIGEVARELKGRTLVLFTAQRALEKTYAELKPKLAESGIQVLAQGISGGRSRILEAFKENEQAIILGTSSFWEGVDLPGDDLQAVVVAKLPFDVPNDPIFEARSQLCVNPFESYALPRAVLRFKQGVGRLIRSENDRGVVLVLDSRIRTQSYGEKFLLSIPEIDVLEIDKGRFIEEVRRFIG